ncbi:hypothetical protein ACFYPK_32695 [Streptomyces halstedii]|uniref:hypothetical protein n=1 Tax=Streptomyces halstedii TaxID=1944 RepID=UPI00346150C1
MARDLRWDANRFQRTARDMAWKVAIYDAHGRQIYATGTLESAAAARYWHACWGGKAAVRRVELTEHVTDITERFVCLGDLPVDGRPAVLPELPDGAHQVNRHYRFTGGPAVLPTPDHVRSYYQWLTAAQEGAVPAVPRADLDKLKLLEVTLIHYARLVQLADLPS